MNKDKNKHGVYIPADLWEQLKLFVKSITMFSARLLYAGR
jgi:hypothetical protein